MLSEDQESIKTKRLLLLLSVALLSTYTARAQPDSRFDGIWVGTETLTPTSTVRPDQQKSIPRPHKTTIAIANGATILGIVGGVCSGRYQQVRRAGNSLTCGAGDCHITVTLSPDGKTLTERGNCQYATMYALRIPTGNWWPVTWASLQISGTFQRSR